MRSFPTLLLAVLSMLLAACGGESSSVRVTARDAGLAEQALQPAEPGEYMEIFLDVVDIRVRHDAAGWVDILDRPILVDLLALQRGDLAELTAAPIAPGVISELRLVLRDGDQGHAVDADGYFIPVRVPSGSQSGLKIKGTIVVPEGADVEIPLVLDLDRALSRTNDGALRIHPVIWLAEPAEDESEPIPPEEDETPGEDDTNPGTDPGENPM